MSGFISASDRLANRVGWLTFILFLCFIGNLGISVYHLYHGSTLLAWAMLSFGLLQLITPGWALMSQASVAHRVQLGDFSMGAALAIRGMFKDSQNDDLSKIVDYLPATLLKFTDFSVRHVATTTLMLLAYMTYSFVVGYPIVDIDVKEIRSYELMIASAVVTIYAWLDFPTMFKALRDVHTKLDGIYLAPIKISITHHQEQGVYPRSS